MWLGLSGVGALRSSHGQAARRLDLGTEEHGERVEASSGPIIGALARLHHCTSFQKTAVLSYSLMLQFADVGMLTDTMDHEAWCQCRVSRLRHSLSAGVSESFQGWLQRARRTPLHLERAWAEVYPDDRLRLFPNPDNKSVAISCFITT